MQKILLSCILGIMVYTPEALADVVPDKIGCSTIGGFEMGLVLLPLIVLGALMFFIVKGTDL